MILEKETYIKFDYYPRDLKPQSHKKILAACDGCGKIRVISKYNYRILCYQCAIQHEETKKKMSEAHRGKHHSEEIKQKIREAGEGKHFSEESKQKMREAKRGEKSYNFGKHFSEKIKQKMSKAKIGENNPSWKGGISSEPYCILFDNEFKERVREFWGRKCMICDKTELANGRKLSVHHVDYNKETCCDDSIPLFVALCISCHSKTISRREYWKKYFEDMIYKCNENGKCFYSEEEYNDIKE